MKHFYNDFFSQFIYEIFRDKKKKFFETSENTVNLFSKRNAEQLYKNPSN